MTAALRFQRAIVIGASSGIGEAVAKALAEDGATVAVLGRRESELQRVAADISSTGKRVLCYVHDVRDFDAVPALFDRVAGDLGFPDIVVYSSGIMPDVARNEYSFAKDRDMIETNLLGAMAWLNVVAPRFQAARAGTIVGISSVAGERGRGRGPAYGSSKAAFSTYLEALRNRLANFGVNVVTIKPGFVDTPMLGGRKKSLVVASPQRAARDILAAAGRGNSASVYVPRWWGLVALVMKAIPSTLMRRIAL